MEDYSVYVHTSPSGKRYIGITKDVARRFAAHGIYYRNCKLFYRAIEKYGWENISHEILFEHLTKQEAEEKERELISLYKSNEREFGYNILRGGDISTNDSEDRRKKISVSVKEYNKTHRDELVARWKKISEKRKGYKASEEAKRKMREHHKGFSGKKMSEEQKKKIADANRGRVMTEEQKDKIRQTRIGKKLSDETKKKISEALTGRKVKTKKIIQKTINGEIMAIYNSAKIAELETGVLKSKIYACCFGRRREAGGYYWEYLND